MNLRAALRRLTGKAEDVPGCGLQCREGEDGGGGDVNQGIKQAKELITSPSKARCGQGNGSQKFGWQGVDLFSDRIPPTCLDKMQSAEPRANLLFPL
ncbi:Neurogenic Locus Notch Protein 2 [Manis pentadactyla]|nr:Neurogenic Locus Notch Protein 2 [Manis pentadactyla]